MTLFEGSKFKNGDRVKLVGRYGVITAEGLRSVGVNVNNLRVVKYPFKYGVYIAEIDHRGRPITPPPWKGFYNWTRDENGMHTKCVVTERDLELIPTKVFDVL